MQRGARNVGLSYSVGLFVAHHGDALTSHLEVWLENLCWLEGWTEQGHGDCV